MINLICERWCSPDGYGSAAMVNDPDPWIKTTVTWLKQAAAADIPILGICFGHQLLAFALGGKVGNNPNGLEVGAVPIKLNHTAKTDPLFKNLPLDVNLSVSHLQSVLTLPPHTVCLASSEKEPHHAYRVGKQLIWGVQFHPEFTTSITNAYVQYYQYTLIENGQDPDSLQKINCDSTIGNTIINRFIALAKTK